MPQLPRLSNREREVINLLLQGKSNKMIASSLNISIRTVEFHLTNIYSKFQVNSRIELILKLVNVTGRIKINKLGLSTVVEMGENTENRDRLDSLKNWAASFRDAISIVGKEFTMKNLMKSIHLLVGIVAALTTGFLWVGILQYNAQLSSEDFTVFTVPLVVVLAIIGLIIAVTGKQRDETLFKIFFSVIFGTGLSPLTVVPIMIFGVMPIGKLVANLGIIDPSIIPAEVASTVGMGIMIMLWLMVSIILGKFLLRLSIKIQLAGNHKQVGENA